VPLKRSLFETDYESYVLLLKIRYNADRGLLNLIAINCSAVPNENTNVIFYIGGSAAKPLTTIVLYNNSERSCRGSILLYEQDIAILCQCLQWTRLGRSQDFYAVFTLMGGGEVNL
jgi:hypothetical protein